ncbi:cyclin dependent kinase inhibitor 1Ca [Brachyhypopomus gauderio]|uniref:cyclin dependent kinase inhibitor 1Ca n=1 Tax=Brachyhypopomus gauderio TaxID=698409 RepID=UPI0040415F6F
MANVEMPGVLERRTFPLLARTKVCRNLFGPVDHEELNCEMKKQLQEISERDQSRWNFNFERNVPLPGSYEWEEILGRSVPSIYQGSVHNGSLRTVSPFHAKDGRSTSECEYKNEPAFRARAEDVQQSSDPDPSSELNQENRSGSFNAGPARVSTGCRAGKRTSVPVSQRTSTHITDFFPKRKKTSDCKQADGAPQTGSSISHEVTPHKRIR